MAFGVVVSYTSTLFGSVYEVFRFYFQPLFSLSIELLMYKLGPLLPLRILYYGIQYINFFK